MAFRDLRDYLAALEARGELKRIPSEVSPNSRRRKSPTGR